MEDLAEVTLKLSLAVVLAGCLGIEREMKGRAAGLRTHILVCLGSTLALIVSDWLSREWTGGQLGGLDRARIAAGVITGIGFLGAGAIITQGNIQRGLTTAALIWFVAALGIAIGLGYYALASVATAFALMTTAGFGAIEPLFPAGRQFSIEIRMARGFDQISAIELFLKESGYRVEASRVRAHRPDDRVELTFSITSKHRPDLERLIKTIHDKFDAVERVTCEL